MRDSDGRDGRRGREFGIGKKGNIRIGENEKWIGFPRVAVIR